MQNKYYEDTEAAQKLCPTNPSYDSGELEEQLWLSDVCREDHRQYDSIRYEILADQLRARRPSGSGDLQRTASPMKTEQNLICIVILNSGRLHDARRVLSSELASVETHAERLELSIRSEMASLRTQSSSRAQELYRHRN